MIITNPSDAAVRDFPIQDPKTGEVALWSILPGETLDFPEFEGRYLVGVYGFLQRIITPEQQALEKQEEEKLNKGKHFTQVKLVSEPGFTNQNMQPPAPEDLRPSNPTLTPPSQQPENPPDPQLTGAVEEVKAAQSTTSPVSVPAQSSGKVGGKVVCPGCGGDFKSTGALKMHYAHQHLHLPGVE